MVSGRGGAGAAGVGIIGVTGTGVKDGGATSASRGSWFAAERAGFAFAACEVVVDRRFGLADGLAFVDLLVDRFGLVAERLVLAAGFAGARFGFAVARVDFFAAACVVVCRALAVEWLVRAASGPPRTARASTNVAIRRLILHLR